MPYFLTGGIAPEEESFAQRERRGNSNFEELDGNHLKIRLEDTSQDDGRRITDGRLDIGRRLLPDHVPTKLSREPWNLRLLSLLDVERYWGPNLLVPEVFKNTLEALEPDVHQFWPMDIYVKGELVTRKYWFIIGQRLTTLSREHCYPPLDESGWWDPSPMGQRENDKVVFSKTAIGNHHAWIDRFQEGMYISMTFGDQLKALNLSGLGLTFDPEA